MNDIILKSQRVSKSYHDGLTDIAVLKSVELEVKKGDRLAIIGPSGCGKSTFLHLLGGLDNPTKGEIAINQMKWQSLNERQRCQVRNKELGFVYQFHHLLPEFSALENVCMPLLLSGMTVKKAQPLASDMLSQVGLSARITHKPSQLSGGERQRVAIARALVHQPSCVLADEPTGNLDQKTASKVLELMLDLNKQMGTALVIVTHDEHIACKMDRVLTLQDGILIP